MTGCSSGVSQEKYDAVVSENNALREQLAQYETPEADHAASGDFQTEGSCPIEIVSQEPSGTEYGHSYAKFTVKNVSGGNIHVLTLRIKILDQDQVVISTTNPQEGVVLANGETIIFKASTEEGAYAMKLDGYSFVRGTDLSGEYVSGYFEGTEEVVLN